MYASKELPLLLPQLSSPLPFCSALPCLLHDPTSRRAAHQEGLCELTGLNVTAASTRILTLSNTCRLVLEGNLFLSRSTFLQLQWAEFSVCVHKYEHTTAASRRENVSPFESLRLNFSLHFSFPVLLSSAGWVFLLLCPPSQTPRGFSMKPGESSHHLLTTGGCG